MPTPRGSARGNSRGIPCMSRSCAFDDGQRSRPLRQPEAPLLAGGDTSPHRLLAAINEIDIYVKDNHWVAENALKMLVELEEKVTELQRSSPKAMPSSNNVTSNSESSGFSGVVREIVEAVKQSQTTWMVRFGEHIQRDFTDLAENHKRALDAYAQRVNSQESLIQNLTRDLRDTCDLMYKKTDRLGMLLPRMDTLVTGGLQHPALMSDISQSPHSAACQTRATSETPQVNTTTESAHTAALLRESTNLIMEELRCVHSKVNETAAKIDISSVTHQRESPPPLQPLAAPVGSSFDMSSMRYNASPRIINLPTKLATTGVKEETLPFSFTMSEIQVKESAADFEDEPYKRRASGTAKTRRRSQRRKSAMETWAGEIDGEKAWCGVSSLDSSLSLKSAGADLGVESLVTSILESVPHNLNGFRIFDAKSLFKAIDRDGTGTIDSDSLHMALSSLAESHVTTQAITEFYSQYDSRGKGAMSWKDFEMSLDHAAAPKQEYESGSEILNSKASSRLDVVQGILDVSENLSEHKKRVPIAEKVKNMGAEQKSNMLDWVTAVVILLNAITIGLSMDYEYTASTAFFVIDVMFTSMFLVELGVKLRLVGVRKNFSSFMNCLDFVLIVADVTQLFLAKVIESSLADSTPPASMFRIVRLIRLGRMARFVKLKICEDFVAMISGIIGGMTTLAWSVALFLLVIYICALLFREFFGKESARLYDIDMTVYFSNVPRSMLTVFRYFFGDFSTAEGYNLLEGIQRSHGVVATLFVSILFFLITIGLFNVIAAIFVESTLAAATGLQKQRKHERLHDSILWSTRITILIRKLFQYHGLELEGALSENLSLYAREQVSELEFKMFMKDDEVVKVLGELEIDDEDHMVLFDILDCDNTGSICLYQLIDGLKRLRGDPRRSDVITVDLMLRAVQEQTDQLVEGMDTALDRLSFIIRRLRK